MNTDRSAGAALKGYAYQFNQSILEILQSPPDGVVTIEGVEDIDLATATAETVVQCKYFAAQSFSLAGIRDAVALMLADSIKAPSRQYRLYIHCGDMTGYTENLDLESIKKCLTVARRKPVVKTERLYEGYTDHQLSDFCARLSIDSGESYEDQTSLVVQALRSALGCSEPDAIELFAPTARDVIFRIAIEPLVGDRAVSRSEFLRRIDSKRGLYTRWHREQVGEDRFVAALKRQIRGSRATDPIRSRMLIADIERNFELSLTIAMQLASGGYGDGYLITAKPWTVLLDGRAEEVARFKLALLDQEVRLHDGFESLGFQPAAFDEWPIVNTVVKSKKIGRASYALRVVGLETFLAHAEELRAPDSVFTLDTRSLPGREVESFCLAGLPEHRMIEVLGVR